MPKPYTHLTYTDRDHIAVLRSAGRSLREIGTVLNRDPGTLSRELCRNAPPVRSGYYLAHKAIGARSSQALPPPALQNPQNTPYPE